MLSFQARLLRVASSSHFVLRTATNEAASRITESYTERMNKTGRPISPHVTIYKFPPAAITSILNRFTGIALFGGCEC